MYSVTTVGMADADTRVIVRYVGSFLDLYDCSKAQTWIMDNFGDYTVESLMSNGHSIIAQFKLHEPKPKPKKTLPSWS